MPAYRFSNGVSRHIKLVRAVVALLQLSVVLLLLACSQSTAEDVVPTPTPTVEPTSATTASAANPAQVVAPSPSHANVGKVSVSGSPGAYTFIVTVTSPDIGCDGYADWWEVLSPDGELLYRRVLLHSHTDEQPFSRNGGPVDIEAHDDVIVRAHMSSAGYGGVAMRGNATDGFAAVSLPDDFSIDVEAQAPLPSDCAF